MESKPSTAAARATGAALAVGLIVGELSVAVANAPAGGERPAFALLMLVAASITGATTFRFGAELRRRSFLVGAAGYFSTAAIAAFGALLIGGLLGGGVFRSFNYPVGAAAALGSAVGLVIGSRDRRSMVSAGLVLLGVSLATVLMYRDTARVRSVVRIEIGQNERGPEVAAVWRAISTATSGEVSLRRGPLSRVANARLANQDQRSVQLVVEFDGLLSQQDSSTVTQEIRAVAPTAVLAWSVRALNRPEHSGGSGS